MTYLTKTQVKQIIQRAPAGTTPEGVVNALRAQGYQLEGYPNQQQEQQLQAASDKQQTKKNVLQKVGDFLGISKFGEGIGIAANNLTGGLKPLEDAQKSLLAESDTLFKQYRAARDSGDKAKAQKLLGLMQQNNEALKVLAQQFTDVGTGGLSNKEVLGSAALTAGNILLAGAGTSGNAVRGSIGATAGEAVKSVVPAIAKPIVRNAGATAYLSSLGANVARSAAVGGAFGVASGAEQNKDTTGIMQSAALGLLVGGAIPVAGEAIRGTAKLAGKGAQYLAQTFSGTPRKAIDYARENPELVKQGIRNAVKDEGTVFRVANTANDAAASIKAKRDSAFKTGLAKLSAKLKGEPIDPTPFNEKLKQSLQRFDVITKNGQINSEGVISDPREIRGVQQILTRMRNQQNLTPEGWWNLKRYVDNFYKPSNSGEFNALVTDISNGLRDAMTENVKGFDKLLRGYEQDSTLLSYLQKELGVKSNARGVKIGGEGELLVQENTKRVINALKRAMQDNQPLADELLKEMQRRGGKQIMGDLTGMYFAEWLPPKLQSILGLGAGSVLGVTAGVGTAAKALPLAAFASPRIVGEGAALSGQITQGLRNIPPELTQLLGAAGRQAGYGGGVRTITK